MKSFLLVLLLIAGCFAQATRTGYLSPSSNGSSGTLSSDMALNAMIGVHSCKKADSVILTPGVKWGSYYVLRAIYNNTGTTQTYTIVDSTAQGLDTFPLNVPAYSLSIPLPYCKKISGATVDSTLWVRQYKP
jgi:hypothetical protein